LISILIWQEVCRALSSSPAQLLESHSRLVSNVLSYVSQTSAWNWAGGGGGTCGGASGSSGASGARGARLGSARPRAFPSSQVPARRFYIYIFCVRYRTLFNSRLWF